MTEPASELAPRRTRLAVFAAMVLIAIGCIWLIDRRAMETMRRLEAEPASPPAEQPASETP